MFKNEIFYLEDILDMRKREVNFSKLAQLRKQINDCASWDKVGSAFYKIDDGSNQKFDFVLEWLIYLSTLKVTSKNVGYLHISHNIKGEDLCNRKACQTNKRVYMWNQSMDAFYCEDCSDKINYDPNNVLCVKDINRAKLLGYDE